jgi:hypothetical protein
MPKRLRGVLGARQARLVALPNSVDREDRLERISLVAVQKKTVENNAGERADLR